MSASADPNTYIVHMDISFMPKAFSSHHSWYLSTLSLISDKAQTQGFPLSSSSSKLVYAYTNAINGFSAVLSSSELEAIKNSPGYISSVKDTSVKVDTTHSFQFLGLNAEHGAWPVSDYGKDIIIGVVDTGVWPESQSFHDDGMSEVPAHWRGKCESGKDFNSSMCNKKLIGARFFNRGLLAKNPNLTISMNSPRDTDGHGTHTSSTAAGSMVEGASLFRYASGTARGMAPKARVAMYKALWDEGLLLSDIIAAIDRAIMDGVDVLSMSFGLNDVALYDDPVAVATFAAIEKGIFVSTSAGNDGPFDTSLHNGTPWVLNVAAGTIDRQFQGSITLDNGVSATGYSLYLGKFSPSVAFPIVFVPDCGNQSSFKTLKHKIVVCVDTNNTLGNQLYYAKNANLSGAVFITKETDLSLYTENLFPSLFLTMAEGQKILDYVKNSPKAKASFKFGETALGIKPGPKLTSYSSRGPSRSCPFVLKPDIMAPGDLILASWPSNLSITENPSVELYSKFNILSGTSMSCPHAAGVAALVKGAHPDWSPAAIRSALITTAYAVDNVGMPIKDLGSKGAPASPLGMGAGHINPNNALEPGLIYDATSQDYINLICALNFTAKQIKTITRSSSYNCLSPSLDLNYPSFIAYFNAKKKNSSSRITIEFQRTLTNVGDVNVVYTAKLTALKGLKVSVSPDRLVFSEKLEKKSYKLMIEGPNRIKDSVVHGSLTWIESNGKYNVRSPIVATNLVVKNPSKGRLFI